MIDSRINRLFGLRINSCTKRGVPRYDEAAMQAADCCDTQKHSRHSALNSSSLYKTVSFSSSALNAAIRVYLDTYVQQ